MALQRETSCEDVQFLLKNLRVIDDKIIYGLNIATPTSSFRAKVDPAQECEKFYHMMFENYKKRGDLLQTCLQSTTDRIATFRAQNENPAAMRQIMSEKSLARELRNEMDIEAILKERSRKVFSEKCYQYYKSTDDW